MFHLACSILNAQTAHIEHILDRQLQLCDSLERAGDSIAAYHQLTRYTRMYDSLVQVVAEEYYNDMEVMTERRRQEVEAQMEQVQLMTEENRRLQHTVDSVRHYLSSLNVELMRHNARLQADSLSHVHHKASVAKEKAEVEAKAQLTRVRFNTYIILSILLCLLLLLVLYYTWKVRRANRILNKATKHTHELYMQAQTAERMKTFFIQNLSHEIRTPLNAIVGFSDMLVSGHDMLDDDEMAMASRMISDNGEQLVTLLSDILDVSHMNSGMMKLRLEPHHVNHILTYAVSTVEGKQAPGVRMRITSEVDDDFMLCTDVTRVRQVLVNFLTNACKYTDEGEIHVQCALDGKQENIVFSVTDTGKGLDKEKGEKVFERFEMLDSMKQGTGLGLNICRLIAERLQGEVRWDSTYTDGARFIFTHPLHLGQDDTHCHGRKGKNGMKTALTAFMMLLSLPTAAQNNIFGIPDIDYERYEELIPIKYGTKKMIRLTEAYAADARRRGEKKSEILLYVPMAKNRKVGLQVRRPYLEIIKKKALKYNITQYYYWALALEISSLLSENRIKEAIKVCQELYDRGKTHTDYYALALYYSNTAKFYITQDFFHKSAEYFMRAADIITRHVPTQNPAFSAGEQLACMAFCSMPLDSIRHEAERLKALARTEESRALIAVSEVLASYLYGKTEDFDRDFPELERKYSQTYLNRSSRYVYLKSIYLARQGQKQEAWDCHHRLNKRNKEKEYQMPASHFFYEMGQCTKAIEMLRHDIAERATLPDPEHVVEFYYDIYHANVRIQEEKAIQKRNIALLEAERLQLQKCALEDSIKTDHLQLWQDSVEMERVAMEYKVERLNAEQEHEEMVKDAELARLRHIRLRIAVRIILATVVIALTYTLLLNRKRRQIKASYRWTRDAMRKAIQGDRNKTQFIHTLSHEIRTPLNAIIGFSTFLSQANGEMSDEEKAEAASSIRYNTDLLSTLINNILELSRLEAGKTKIHMNQHDLLPICAEMVAAYRGKKSEVEVKFESELPEGFTYCFDMVRMKSVLHKLMDNAVKFTAKGHVLLWVGLRKDWDNLVKLHLVVEDTGKGISKEDSERIFEQFYKADHFEVGTGLGLSIARLSVEKMGGTLTLDTSYRQGARFVITL